MNNVQINRNSSENMARQASLRGEAPQEHGMVGRRIIWSNREEAKGELVIEHKEKDSVFVVRNSDGVLVMLISDWFPEPVSICIAKFFAEEFLKCHVCVIEA